MTRSGLSYLCKTVTKYTLPSFYHDAKTKSSYFLGPLFSPLCHSGSLLQGLEKKMTTY